MHLSIQIAEVAVNQKLQTDVYAVMPGAIEFHFASDLRQSDRPKKYTKLMFLERGFDFDNSDSQEMVTIVTNVMTDSALDMSDVTVTRHFMSFHFSVTADEQLVADLLVDIAKAAGCDVDDVRAENSAK